MTLVKVYVVYIISLLHMKKSVLITGIAGSGKSSISKKLKEFGFSAHDLDSVPGLFTMVNKKTRELITDHDNEDLEKVMRMDWICDTEKLTSLVEKELQQIAFYCGTATNIDEIDHLFDTTVLLKTHPKTTRKRLTERTDNDFARKSVIQDWLLGWKDEWERKIEDRGVIVVNTDKSLEEVVKEIVEKTQVKLGLYS